MMNTIVIVDGICPRGLAIIRYLSSTGEYHILVFTESTACPGATAASNLPNVTLLLNRASTGYDLQTFVAAVQRCPCVLICSNSANAEGREGVQWGARLVQSAAAAGAKHLVSLSMDRERTQLSLDNFIHSQARAPMAWTIIRSIVAGSSQSQPSSQGSERDLSATQLRNLAYYVNWVFSNRERCSGLDFVLPPTEQTGVGSPSSGQKRRDSRDSRMDNARPADESPQQLTSTMSRYIVPRADGEADFRALPARSRENGSGFMDPNRASAIQQWVAKTSPDVKDDDNDSEDEDEEDEEEDELSSSESG